MYHSGSIRSEVKFIFVTYDFIYVNEYLRPEQCAISFLRLVSCSKIPSSILLHNRTTVFSRFLHQKYEEDLTRLQSILADTMIYTIKSNKLFKNDTHEPAFHWPRMHWFQKQNRDWAGVALWHKLHLQCFEQNGQYILFSEYYVTIVVWIRLKISQK